MLNPAYMNLAYLHRPTNRKPVPDTLPQDLIGFSSINGAQSAGDAPAHRLDAASYFVF
jgi:hypothetical protein